MAAEEKLREIRKDTTRLKGERMAEKRRQDAIKERNARPNS